MLSVCSYSLFSMDGDFAPMIELVKLRKKYEFLLVIDDVSSLNFLQCCWKLNKFFKPVF